MNYDVIVVGGGHAGVEAIHALHKLKIKALLVTGNMENIATLPCNPSIGGPAKGVLAREIDALGGIMGEATDNSTIQIKMLNESKGPAVRALRAQVDKLKYPKEIKRILDREKINIKIGLVKKLLIKNNIVNGIILDNEEIIYSKIVILTTGTYLGSKILVGNDIKEEGPDNEPTTKGISNQLREIGFDVQRLKTGTPPRVFKDSIDYSKTKEQPGSNKELCFSNYNKEVLDINDQKSCFLTYTNSKTHKILNNNLSKSSMYSGNIEGVGARYCPSIEDKLVRFSDKDRHQVFLEPESLSLDTLYVQGFSTSMPKEIQEEAIKTISGLENVIIDKYAYAIEYDAINPINLKINLESKIIENLFFAGQINSTSGYEEAASQGLVAGINAYRKIKNKEHFILTRDSSYIGVLIDDLVTKGTKEPYRMLTSRSEFRLLLRNDNADERLTKIGYELGLIDDKKYLKIKEKYQNVSYLIEKLKDEKIKPNTLYTSNPNLGVILKNSITAYDLIKRPDFDIRDLLNILNFLNDYDELILEAVSINIKYKGYIDKSIKQASKINNLEKNKIPSNIDYNNITNLALEAREKLNNIRPTTLGQASRISGVNPSDISILLIYLESIKNG